FRAYERAARIAKRKNLLSVIRKLVRSRSSARSRDWLAVPIRIGDRAAMRRPRGGRAHERIGPLTVHGRPRPHLRCPHPPVLRWGDGIRAPAPGTLTKPAIKQGTCQR